MLKKRVLILTGAPGVGKTTVLVRTVDALRAQGESVGGMISSEAREGKIRVGFEILDLANGKQGWLAHINQKDGPQVGKYRVNIGDLEEIGVKAIVDAAEKCNVVAIDEVGPMELFSQRFKQAVKQVVTSKKLVLAVVHAKARDELISQIKEREDTAVFTVTLLNRDNLPGVLIEKISEI